jgi:hypothetical protein
MTDNLDTIKRLMALALDDGASLEESRTAAVAACRMIETNFDIVAKVVHPKSSRRNYAKYRVTHCSRCRACGDVLLPGEWAFYFRDEVGSYHHLCIPT